MRIIERGSWTERRMRRRAAAQPEGVSKPGSGEPLEPGVQPTPDPIEPDIGVPGSTVFWTLVGLVVFFYHWGGVLVFAAHFVLAGTPYALVEARASDAAPLRHDDVVVVRRDVASLEPGQIVWVARGDGATDLQQVFVVGPGVARPEVFVQLDSATVSAARAGETIAIGDRVLVTGRLGRASGDTLAELTPRDRVLGRATQVILPLHRIRELP